MEVGKIFLGGMRRKRKKMTNKEVIENLQSYFLEQDPKVVALLCSHVLMDLNRLYLIKQLDEESQLVLIDRITNNLSIFQRVFHAPGDPVSVSYQFHQEVAEEN